MLNDPSAAPLRRKSMESTFSKGHGLPGRVFATGAAEVIQDSSFVSAQHYSLRPAAHSGGMLTESLAVPIFVTAPELSPTLGKENDPIGVLEVIMASNQLVVAQELAGTSQEGRLRLVQGGAAAVIASICAALDSAGLSCSPPPSADEECVPVKDAECIGTSWGGGRGDSNGSNGRHRRWPGRRKPRVCGRWAPHAASQRQPVANLIASRVARLGCGRWALMRWKQVPADVQCCCFARCNADKDVW